MLEEVGLPYEPHLVNIMQNETRTPEFLSLNPNGKIPAIIDPDGPGGKPLALFESGAILIYLADKSGKLMPKDAAGRYQTMAWVFFQVGAIGPMFGQVGFFYKFAGKDYEDKRPLQRYVDESARLLKVMESGYDARVITAINESLADLTKSMRLIEPLARKISALELRVPALRERGGDLMLLTEHLLRRFCAPSSPPELSVGKSPEGRALKFVHRGSYDVMDSTYEAITNYLDSKKLEARDLFAEQYVTDPLKTPEDLLVIEVYVPVK